MQLNNNQNIICFGEVLWDMLPSGAKPGGAPLNVAIHLKKQGKNPHLISKIGNDEHGNELLEFLKESGIDSNYIQTDEKLPTSKVLVHLDKNKNASYEICEPVAWDNIQFNKAIERLSKQADFLIFGSLASRNNETLSTLLQSIENTKAQKILDVNLRPPFDNKERIEQLIQLSDFVKLNDEELEQIASWNTISGNEKELMQWFVSNYKCQTLCVTRGDKGAALYIHHKIYEHPGFKVKAEDTVGAGDSFLASLLASLLKNNAPQEALETACATGAFVASQEGAVPDYSEKEIEIIKKSTL